MNKYDYNEAVNKFSESMQNAVDIYMQEIKKIAEMFGLTYVDMQRAKIYDKIYPHWLESVLCHIPIVDAVYGRFANFVSDRWPVRWLPEVED